jgi:hypothetical protein
MRIEELRATLAEHADGIDDSPHARVPSVRRRVAAARRRRHRVVAGGTAVAVVAVLLAVVPALSRDRQVAPAHVRAPRELAGRPVPRTQEAVGFDYRYVRGYQSRPGQRSLDVQVTVGDTPRLVMWASSDTTTEPVVRLEHRGGDAGEGPEASAAGGFHRYAYLPANGGGTARTERLRLTEEGGHAHTRLGLAVYDLTGPPPGTGNGTVTYRDHVLAESLVKAVVGRPGQTDVRFRLRIPSTDLGWAPTCYGTRRWLTVSVDGGPLLGTSCGVEPNPDPGADPDTFDGSVLPPGVGPGATVTVRVHLSPSSSDTGTVARDPDAVLGLGVYTHRAPSHRLAGLDLPDAVEDSGHQWLAARWQQSGPGARSLSLRLPVSDHPRLVRWGAGGLAEGPSRTVLRVAPDGTGPGRVVEENQSSAGGDAFGTAYVVQPGQAPRVTVEVPRGSTARTLLGLVVSDLVS